MRFRALAPLGGLLLLLPFAGPTTSAEAAAPPGVQEADPEIPITTEHRSAVRAFRAGQALADVGRPREAAEQFRRAVKEDPGFTYAWLGLAGAASSPEEFKAALDRASASMDDKSEGEKLLVRIDRTLLGNDAELRLELTRRLVELHPRSVRARLQRASALAAVDRHDEARRELREAVELGPGLYVTHASLGVSHLFNEPRDPALAARHMERLVELFPGEAKSHEALGDARRALGDLEGARAAYTAALERDPALAVAALKKGHVNSFLGRVDEALLDYDTALLGAKESDRVIYANYRAFVQVHAGNPAEAVRELMRLADAVDHEDVPGSQRSAARIFTLTNAAAIALHADLPDHAETVLREREAAMVEEADRIGEEGFRRGQMADVRLWQARLAAARGDLPGARRKLEEHRQLMEQERDPTRLQGYHTVLGIVELLKGDPVKAADHLRQGDPEDIYATYHLGLALEASGDTSRARELFADVAGYNFNSVEYALLRRDALQRKG